MLIEIYNDRRWINIVNEGFGINPLIHLLYQLVTAPNNSTLIVEEPEIHLHPSAQLVLCLILIETALKDGKRLIVTTHSEHILLGFLDAIIG